MSRASLFSIEVWFLGISRKVKTTKVKDSGWALMPLTGMRLITDTNQMSKREQRKAVLLK